MSKLLDAVTKNMPEEQEADGTESENYTTEPVCVGYARTGMY